MPTLKVSKATDLSRSGAPELPASVAAEVFQIPVGKAGAAPVPRWRTASSSRSMRRSVPSLKPGDQQFEKLMAQVKSGVTDDVLAQYLSEAQHEIGVKLNERALQTALSDDSSS